MVVGIERFCLHTMLLATMGLLCANKSTKVCTTSKRHILSGWISISHQRPRHVYNMRNLISLQGCSKEKPGLTLIIVGILSEIFQSVLVVLHSAVVLKGQGQREEVATYDLYFSSCYRVRALFSSNLPSVPSQTFIQASVLRFMQETTGEWLRRFEGTGVPCGPINNIQQVFANPQVSLRSHQWFKTVANSVQTVVFVQKGTKCLVQTWIHITVLKAKHFLYQYTVYI